ncbi:hypothetical protein AK812_SmicGene48297, partial [Symbiodinium microadriaticum]
ADSRYISTSDLSPLDARYFVRELFPEGSDATPWWPPSTRWAAQSPHGRVSTLEFQVGAIDGWVTALENSGSIAPTVDLTVNSLTATSFVEDDALLDVTMAAASSVTANLEVVSNLWAAFCGVLVNNIPSQRSNRVQALSLDYLFNAVESHCYDRILPPGFIVQDVQGTGKLGETLCKTMSGKLLALDH